MLPRSVPAKAPFEGLSEVHAAIGYDRCLRLVVADSEAERVAGLIFDRGLAGVDRPTDVKDFIGSRAYRPEYQPLL